MGVTVNTTPISPYTWDTGASIVFQEATAALKTWDTSIIYDFDVDADDPLNTAPSLSNEWGSDFAEAFGFADGYENISALEIGEALGISETYVNSGIGINVSENLPIAEALGKDVTLATFQEAFSIAYASSRQPGLGISESLNFIDAWGDFIQWVLEISETLDFDDDETKDVSLSVAEVLALFEAYRRNGNAVLSGMLFRNDQITDAEFTTLIKRYALPGYSNFKVYQPGNYTYRDAIIKMAIDSVTGDRADLNKLKLTVDVPDVRDSGTAAVVNSPTNITFAKTFNVAPDVVVTVKGGTVASTPRISNITTTGFTVELFNNVGVHVFGTVTWIAEGY